LGRVREIDVMQTQIEAPSRSPKIYSWRDMPSRKRDPRDVLRAIANGTAGAVAASKSAAAAVIPPTTIFGANLYLWWTSEGAGVTNTTGVVSAVTDQSGNAHNGTMWGAGPAIVTTDASLSNCQTLTCASGKTFYANPVSLSPPFTLIAVVNVSTWINGNVIWGDAAAHGIQTAAGSPNIAMNFGAYGNYAAFPLGSWALCIQEQTNSTSDRQKVGSGAWTTTPGTNTGAAALTLLGFNIAGGPGAGGFQFFQGLAITGTPSAGQYTSLRTWLTSRSASILL
jgi:hypothetical protein